VTRRRPEAIGLKIPQDPMQSRTPPTIGKGRKVALSLE
jgi:hypothetical protein